MRGLLLLACLGCGDPVRLPRAVSGGGGSSLVSIAINPASPRAVSVGSPQQLTATGTYSSPIYPGGPTTANITSEVTWSSDDASIATVSNGSAGGLLSGVGRGAAHITASLGPVSSPALTANVTFIPTLATLSPDSGSDGDSIVLTGTNFYGVSGAAAVKFNGQNAASYVVNSPTQITAVVPTGATNGPVTVVTEGGTATGPSFTVGVSLDFTSGVVPADVTAVRSGSNMVAQRSPTTAVISSTPEVFEKRASRGGLATFPSFTNLVTNPFDHSVAAGWSHVNGPVYTASIAGAPDGTPTAERIDDQSVGARMQISKVFGANGMNAHTLWMRGAPATPPSKQGFFFGDPTGNYGANAGVATTWRKMAAWYQGNPTHAITWAGYENTPPVTVDVAATGAYDIWFSQQLANNNINLPGVNGTSGDAYLTLGSQRLSKIALNGDLDIGGSFISMLHSGPDGLSGGTLAHPDGYVWWLSFAEGEFSLRYESGVFKFKAKGTDILSITLGGMQDGIEIVWRCVYRPSTSEAVLQIISGGAYQTEIATAVAGAVALSTPTAGQLGAKNGTGIFPVIHTNFGTRNGAYAKSPEIVVLGDSLNENYAQVMMTPSEIYTPAEALTRPGIAVLAHQGDKAQDQLAKWNASRYPGMPSIKAAVIHVGINNLGQGQDAATTIANIQALVNKVKSDCPGIKVALLKLCPAKTYLDGISGAAYGYWVLVQQAIMGLGGTPITGVDDRASAHEAELNNGADSLKDKYNIGDNIHVFNSGRRVIAVEERAALVRVGVLP